MKKFLMGCAVAVVGLLGCSREQAETAASGAAAAHSPEVVITSEEHFASAVEQSSVPVLVDFWATWCGPCKKMNPILKELAAEYEGRLVVAKVDVDQHAALAERFKVESIPLLVLFKDGKPADLLLGARSKAELSGWIDARLSP